MNDEEIIPPVCSSSTDPSSASPPHQQKTIHLRASRSPHTLVTIFMCRNATLRVHDLSVFHEHGVAFAVGDNANVLFSKALDGQTITRTLYMNVDDKARFNVKGKYPTLSVSDLQLYISGTAEVKRIRVAESMTGKVSGMAKVSDIVRAFPFEPRVEIARTSSVIVDGNPLDSSSEAGGTHYLPTDLNGIPLFSYIPVQGEKQHFSFG